MTNREKYCEGKGYFLEDKYTKIWCYQSVDRSSVYSSQFLKCELIVEKEQLRTFCIMDQQVCFRGELNFCSLEGVKNLNFKMCGIKI